MKKEPAVTIGAIGAAVGSLIALLVAFGIEISPDQEKAILGFVAAAGPLIVALITRQFVWSPESVDEQVAGSKLDAHIDPDVDVLEYGDGIEDRDV